STAPNSNGTGPRRMGWFWGIGHDLNTFVTTFQGPNAPRSLCDDDALIIDYTSPPTAANGTGIRTLGLSSYHTGGANVCMGDGTVHFLSDSTDVSIMRAIGTVAANDVTGGDFGQ
ncbi:MAG: H-X9-DG-CTERM domain-containing protein, partial [Planctomycetia bacterium]